MNTGCYSNTIFQEAINHCRWKKVLHTVLRDINIINYKNDTFDEIMIKIYSICERVKGIGMLTIYDITSAICRFYQIHIDKVYIIGKGPQCAVDLLEIQTKRKQINDNICITYVDISDVIHAFDSKCYKLDENIRTTKNGDMIETYLCNWQKRNKGMPRY